MRRLLMVPVLAAILSPSGSGAQSPEPPAPAPAEICVSLSSAGPWTPETLISALLSGMVTIESVGDPVGCGVTDAPADDVALGETVQVGDLHVTVERVQFARDGKRRVVGVFFFVRYHAIAEAYASAVDWNAYAGDSLMEFVSYVRKPKLLTGGSLQAGRETSGWVGFVGRIRAGTPVTLTFAPPVVDAGFNVVVDCCRDLP